MFPKHEWNNNVRTDTCISEQVAKTFDKRFPIGTFETTRDKRTVSPLLDRYAISILFLFSFFSFFFLLLYFHEKATVKNSRSTTAQFYDRVILQSFLLAFITYIR